MNKVIKIWKWIAWITIVVACAVLIYKIGGYVGMKYRKLPVEIEAFRFQIDEYMPDWFNIARFDNTIITHNDGTCDIRTLEGTIHADKGDYIIQGVNGEFYPCKPDVFEKTYVKAQVH